MTPCGPFQGDFAALARRRVMIDNADFLQDGLFCEWGYVADLDADQLVVYRGFTRDPAQQDPRYALTVPDALGYWGCRRPRDFDLAALPDPDTFVRLVQAADRHAQRKPPRLAVLLRTCAWQSPWA
jgi:hypothetical protein